MSIQRGDTVRHIPTGEEWIILRAEDGYVYPAGWPKSRARAADCELVRGATEKDIAWLDRAERGTTGGKG